VSADGTLVRANASYKSFVPIEVAMDPEEKAGYLLPSEASGGQRRRLAAFAIDDLTAEEEEELLKYLAFLRSRSSS
jgi:hypothetical protein